MASSPPRPGGRRSALAVLALCFAQEIDAVLDAGGVPRIRHAGGD